MEARSLSPAVARVIVSRGDLVQAWSVLERLTVSLRRLGSHYAIPQGQAALSEARRREMLESLDSLFSPELCRDIAHARRLLSAHLPDEEAEALADHLETWRPPPSET